MREFETLLGAGVVDSRGQHANTVGRMVEALALSSGYVASGRAGGIDPATAPFTSTVYVPWATRACCRSSLTHLLSISLVLRPFPHRSICVAVFFFLLLCASVFPSAAVCCTCLGAVAGTSS